jgi:tetratricopeptide (TPR) repeat protein
VTDLLRRALVLSPNDLLALRVTADVNLCDCINAWSKNTREQRAIGAEAVDRYLHIDPGNPGMLRRKADIFQLDGRWEESLAVADAVLRQNPEDEEGLMLKTEALLKLERPQEALPIADSLRERMQDKMPEVIVTDANVHFAVGDYDLAASLAQAASTRMTEDQLRNPVTGPVRLTLAASEAKLGRKDRAERAMADFRSSVPGVTSITEIRKWMAPNADLANFEPLFAALRLAAVPE